jgi:4-hydroxybenzoate polyprenyltransferase
MLYQTSTFLLHIAPCIYLAAFVFSATICSYSFHWYLTGDSVLPSSRVVWLHRYRRIHLFLFFAGLIGAMISAVYLLPFWRWLLLSALVTFLYSAPKIPHPLFRSLRKVALGKTVFLAMVWTFVTTILPVVVSQLPWQPAFILYCVSRFCLIYAICILFDYRDRQDDKAAGIRSLITYLSEKGITVLFIVSLLLYAALTIWLLQYGYSGLEIGLLLVPGVIVALFYNYARTHFYDMFYYGFLDGLMALSAVLMVVADSVSG